MHFATVIFAALTTAALSVSSADATSSPPRPDSYGEIINMGAKLMHARVRLALEECPKDKAVCVYGNGEGISCIVSGAAGPLTGVVCMLGDRKKAMDLIELMNLTMLMLSPDSSSDERELTINRMAEEATGSEDKSGSARLHGSQYEVSTGGLFVTFSAKPPPQQ